MTVDTPENLATSLLPMLYKTAVKAGTLAFGHLVNLEHEEAKECMGMYLDCCWWMVRIGAAASFEDAEMVLAAKFPDGFHDFVHRELSDDPADREYRIGRAKGTVSNA